MPAKRTVVKGSDLKEDYMVEVARIIGTTFTSYSAWRPDPNRRGKDGSFHQCGTICFEEGRWWGRIGTGADKSKYANLPMGQARSDAVDKAYLEEYDLGYKLILSVHPEARNGEQCMGEITLGD